MIGIMNLFDFVEHTVSGGYVLALTLICLVQYAFHMYRSASARRQNERFRRKVQSLEEDLQLMQKNGTLSRLENQILREFVSQTEIDKALALLLRRFVPDSSQGLGAFVEFDDAGHRVDPVRGLTQQSRDNLRIESSLRDEVSRDRIVTLEGAKLHESELLASLSATDRRKVTRLYLLGVGSQERIAGTLVTTGLYPPSAPQQQQIELAKRLMLSVSGNLERSQALVHRENQLRSTSELLQLRSITDGQFESPLGMIEAFIDRLREIIAADRITLYLSRDEFAPLNILVRCGAEMQSAINQRWLAHEEKLATTCIGMRDVFNFPPEDLRRLGIDSLIGFAQVVPVVHESGPVGILCLTRANQRKFSEANSQLIEWSADYLADQILRVLNHAAVVKQARQDSLTELANRRTFDDAIVRELKRAARADQECTVMLLDLDRFKAINDNYGHPAGDLVLRVVAGVLQEQIAQIRSDDRALTARYGGEELAVLLPGIGRRGALRIGESIRRAVAAARTVCQGHVLKVTLSGGIASFPCDGENAEELVAAADDALYRAKQSGRNHLCCANEASHARVECAGR